MQLSQSIKPISYVKAHAAEIIRNVAETGNPLIITQNGEAKAVLMDVREYDEMRESMAMLKMIAVSSREVQEGHTRDADEVFDGIASKLRTRRNAEKQTI
jgi:prevent-host-death family protein